MQDDDAKVLRNCVLECSRDVFSACAIPCGPGLDDGHEGTLDGQVATFIGFSGRRLRGTLTMVAPYALLLAAYPVPARAAPAVPEAEILDWSGEVANLLLGRITNKLAARGAELLPSTPKALRVERSRVHGSTPLTVCELHFQSGDARIGIWLDAVTLDDEPLFSSSTSPMECQTEGELAFL